MSSRIAVVTGANKGIGLHIARTLRQSFPGVVYVTSRNVERGEEAIKEIEKLDSAAGGKLEYHQLDIDNFKSIQNFREHLMVKHGGLDVLVNNAGIKIKDKTLPEVMKAKITMATNYFGTLNMSNLMLPLMKENGRVVNVAGFVAQTALKQCSPEIQALLRDESLQLDQVTSLMHDYIDCAVTSGYQERGFPAQEDAYSVSKMGVVGMSLCHARQMVAGGRGDVLVNACCPGWCRTDMAGEKALKSAEEGAVTPTYLANLPQGETQPQGKFVSNKRVAKW